MDNQNSNRYYLSWATVGCLAIFIMPLMVGAGIVVFEYAIVNPSVQSWPRTAVELYLALIAMLFLVGVHTLYVWAKRDQFVRESFALALFGLVLLLVVSVGMAPFSGLTPWTLLMPLEQWRSNLEVQRPSLVAVDYALLLVLLLLLCFVLSAQHRVWPGLISQQQQARDELHESPSLVAEAMAEVWRLLRFAPPFAAMLPVQPATHPILPNEDVVSLAWKDQARELLTMSNASYTIEPETDWHDVQGCWIGQNDRSKGLVLLYPAQTIADLDRSKDVIAYARAMAKRRSTELDNIHIALKEDADVANLKHSFPNIYKYIEPEPMLLQGLANFADYRNELSRRVTKETLPESPLTLQDVFVAPRVRVPGNADDVDLETHLRNWLAEPSRRHLALLGDYGQGKSTAARMFAYTLMSEPKQMSLRIPLVIELRGQNVRNQEPYEILGSWASRFGRMGGQTLLRLHEAGRLLIIFEGFDEMAGLSDYSTRYSYFKALWAFSAYPLAKILITGRPNLFANPEEMEAALGLRNPFPGEAYCQPIILQPFTLNQIEKALRAQKHQVREQIVDLAQHNPQFRDIVSRPSLLHVVSVLWEDHQLAKHITELTSAYVMGLFVHNSYTRQGNKEKVQSTLNVSERAYFMSGIATYMGANKLANIDTTQLDMQIGRLLGAIPNSVSQEITAISGQDNRPLRQRLQNPVTKMIDQEQIALLQTDVRTSGLLVTDPAVPGAFRFGHKSFMEYLFAEVVAKQIQHTKSPAASAIFSATKSDISGILNQPVAIEYLAELLGGTAQSSEQSKKTTPLLEEKLNGEVMRAKKLMEILFDINGYIGYLKKLDLFVFMLITILNRISPLFVWLFFSFLFYVTIMLIVRVFSFLINIIKPINEIVATAIGIVQSIVLFALITYFFVLLVDYTINFLGSEGRNKKYIKLKMWNVICNRWKISDLAMHAVVGTNYLLWIRDQPFFYFLDINEQAISLINRLRNPVTFESSLIPKAKRLVMSQKLDNQIKQELQTLLLRLESQVRDDADATP